jgi:sugar phosphate isomerase/epimerase
VTLLSFQLWSSRKDPSLRNQLAVLKDARYDDAQPHHAQYGDPAGLRALLDEFGLSAKSAHIHHDMLKDFAGTVSAMRTIGVELVIMPWLPAPLIPTDRAGWTSLGREMETFRRRFADEGLRFAWHNHHQELTPLPDGSFPIEHVLGDELLWEIDIGWVFVAGADPLAWLDRYRGRVPAIHVKDIPRPGENLEEDGQITIGAGIVDWPTLWPACIAAGAELMVAEHDQPLDSARFARDSMVTMRALAGRT